MFNLLDITDEFNIIELLYYYSLIDITNEFNVIEI